MIGRLRGRIEHTLDPDLALIDVGGVGYSVFCPARVLAALPNGEMGELIIETHVREDHIHLYGFASAIERDWFRLLTSVQGVGVRMGITMLGQFTPDQLTSMIAAQDKKALTAVSGVGPKLAERIITELKNKVAKMATVIELPKVKGTGAIEASSVSEDAVSALVNLGYGRSDAYTVVAQLLQVNADAGLDALIKEGLKRLAS